MPGNTANVKCCYLYDTMPPSEQHMHNLFIIHKYLLNSNVECFSMYITSLLFSKLVILQVSTGLPVNTQKLLLLHISSWHLSLSFYTLSLRVKTKTIQWPNRPYTTSLICLTSQPLSPHIPLLLLPVPAPRAPPPPFSLSDAIHVWLKCKIPSSCVEYLLYT